MFKRKTPSISGDVSIPLIITILLLTVTASQFETSSSAKVRASAKAESSQFQKPKSSTQTADNLHELDNASVRNDPSGIPNTPSGWPVQGRITSRFGARRMGRHAEFHHGLDIAVPVGTEVDATANGEVVFAARQSGYGNLVVIDHGNGVSTRYGHLSEISVTAGQKMNRGAALGLSGSTGRSTGPHVHYEIRENGVPVNPMKSTGQSFVDLIPKHLISSPSAISISCLPQ